MSSDAYLEAMADIIVEQIKLSRKLREEIKKTPPDPEIIKRFKKDWEDVKKLRQLVEQKLKAEGLL
jgi:DNA-directed RNA polymerase sigma subunit (sigma70/sigma32)